MASLLSSSFAGDPLLTKIAAGSPDRISKTQNANAPSVLRIQPALLEWDPGILPVAGADGDYGDETATAVVKFKTDELNVQPAELFDDVGPRTAVRLDEIMHSVEAGRPVTTKYRRDVWDLIQPWDPITRAYARAVRAMQARPGTDPTSWTFQAAMHETYLTPPDPAWGKCQHRHWFFLPWHRMYLYFFERIVAKAVRDSGGPGEFALPYWNYDRGAPANTLPAVFGAPSIDDNTPNPLFVPSPRRHLAIGASLDPLDTSSLAAMAQTQFVNPAIGTGFGGGVSAPATFGGSSGALELQPHNVLHNRIGGFLPDDAPTDCSIAMMSDNKCAALDPIFWLHHANIDRLWEAWLNLGAGRENPTDDDWLDQEFTFFDENGNPQTMPVWRFQDTANRLDYAYADLAAAPPVRSVVQVSGPPELAGATETPLELVGRSVARLTVPAVGRRRLGAVAGDSAVYLSIEDVEATHNPGVVYRVYLNLPDAPTDEERVRHFVGNFTAFGVEMLNDPDRVHTGAPGLRHTFDITQVVQDLQARGEWDPGSLTVTMEPAAPPSPPGVVPPTVEVTHEPIRIGRIAVFAAP